jgi:hypothetical protein
LRHLRVICVKSRQFDNNAIVKTLDDAEEKDMDRDDIEEIEDRRKRTLS